MPGDYYGGDSGFVSDSDGAQANLNITMSEDSARNLWDVQAAIQQISADLQAATRSAADFNSYLISIRETSQTVKMPSLGMEGGESGNMTYAGGRVDSGSVPLVQSEIGMAGRIGEMEENSTGAGGGVMSARAPSPRGMDVDGLVSQMTNVGFLAGMTGQQHSRVPEPPDPSLGPVPGPVPGGYQGRHAARAASQVVGQALPAAQQFLRGGGAGGFATAAGRLGVYGALGYAGYQLVDAGLQTYVQSRAMAISANNSQLGAGWGFEQRINQGVMAMSPYVSSEQVDQIYGTAVDQGWASSNMKQGNFDQALNFMYGAAKDYNIDPSVSGQMLQDSTLKAGESIQSLAGQLLTLKETVDGTGISMNAATTSFASLNSFLIASGANPGTAAAVSGGVVSAFAGNTYLQNGAGANVVQGALQSKQTQNILAGLTGVHPGAVFSGNNATRSMAELDKLNFRLAQDAINSAGMDVDNKAAMFAMSYNALHHENISQADAKALMLEYSSNPNYLVDAQKSYEGNSTMGGLQHQNMFQSWWQGLDAGGLGSSLTGNARSTEEVERDSNAINSYDYYSPEVNTLLSNSGDLSNVVLYGPDGQPLMENGKRIAGTNIAKWFSDQSNYDKFTAQGSKYYIKDDKDQTHNAANIGLGGSGSAVNGGDITEANTVYITLSSEAKRWFDTNKDKLSLDDGKN